LGRIGEVVAEVLIVSGDADHGGIVGDQFFGVGEVDGKAVFGGNGAGSIAQGDVADDSATQEDHFGRVEVDGTTETSHQVFEYGLLE